MAESTASSTAAAATAGDASALLALAADWLWRLDAELRTFSFAAPGAGPGASRPLADCFDAEGDPVAWAALQAALAECTAFRNLVLRFNPAPGHRRLIRLSGAPVADADDNFAGFRGVAIDITGEMTALANQKRLAEQHLKHLNWFREAIDAVGHSIVIFDEAGRIVLCNKFYRDSFIVGDRGLPPDFVFEGTTYRELMELRVKYKLHKEFADQPERFVEDRMRRFERGEDHTINLANGMIHRGQYRNLPNGIRVYVGSEISDLIAAERKRRELEGQLDRYHGQRLEALGTLAGGIAHDLNNTLQPILALTKITARTLPEGSTERNNLEIVLAASNRARELVRQILTFSRKESLHQEVFDLSAVVREAARMLRAVVASSIRIDVAVAETPPMLGDAGQWHQILVNLVSNAALAIGAAPGSIAITLEADQGLLKLIVSDSGCGMTEAVRQRVFEPFFSTRQVGEGTGLGLSVVHGIVTNHGGRISVESKPGDGSRFIIEVPSAKPAPENKS